MKRVNRLFAINIDFLQYSHKEDAIEKTHTLSSRFILIAFVSMIFFIGCCAKKDTHQQPGANTGEVLLTWDESHQADLAGYKIYYGTESRNYTEMVDVGLTESPEKPRYLIRNLQKGKTYFFAVTAYDRSNNESGFSNETSKEIQ